MTQTLIVALVVGALMVLCSGLDLWASEAGFDPEAGADTPFLVFLIGVVVVIVSLAGLAFELVERLTR